MNVVHVLVAALAAWAAVLTLLIVVLVVATFRPRRAGVRATSPSPATPVPGDYAVRTANDLGVSRRDRRDEIAFLEAHWRSKKTYSREG